MILVTRSSLSTVVGNSMLPISHRYKFPRFKMKIISMDINKAETPEDEREISLNETSIKRPLDVIDVIGGHGPWQFRLWTVFFVATLWNSMVLFSALFLPSQIFCPHENSTGVQYGMVSSSEVNGSVASPETRNFFKQASFLSADILEKVCNGTDCRTNVSASNPAVSSSKVFTTVECWNSQIEIFTKCSYLVACAFSGLMVYLAANKFGRRPIALLSSVILFASSLATSWAYSAPVYLILRSITSIVSVNIYFISAFSLLEYVHEDFKLLYFLTGHLGWGVAHFLLPAVAWMADDWKSFNVLLSIISMFLAFLVWWSPESPSSFPNKGEHTRMRKILKYAAFTNGYSTTHVDMLTHNYNLRQENKHELGTLASVKDKIFFLLYSSILFAISFTTAFLYFGAKWHTEWFKVANGRMSFLFLGTTEVAATLIMLFLTSFIAIKYLWTIVSASLSVLMIIIYSRSNEGSSKTPALLYTLSVFFAAATWTLVMTKSFCHKIVTSTAKFNLAITGVAVFAGAFAASTVVLNGGDQDLLLAFAVPHLIFAAVMLFMPDDFFGTV